MEEGFCFARCALSKRRADLWGARVRWKRCLAGLGFASGPCIMRTPSDFESR